MRCWGRGLAAVPDRRAVYGLHRAEELNREGFRGAPDSARRGSAGWTSMSGAVTEALTATCSVTSAAAFTSAERLRVSPARS